VREAPGDVRAGVMAANSVIGRVGQTTGPVFAGLLFTLGGSDMLFIAAALFILIMLFLLSLALSWRPAGQQR
jgi:predicted MFS family arabinose efflux permease